MNHIILLLLNFMLLVFFRFLRIFLFFYFLFVIVYLFIFKVKAYTLFHFDVYTSFKLLKTHKHYLRLLKHCSIQQCKEHTRKSKKQVHYILYKL